MGSSVTEPVAGPSSGETKSMETVNLAMQHLAAGKRDLLISDPNAAVASLALACELLGTHYGEIAFECGESYYYYGRALLELARLEAGVIENLDGDAESEENSVEDDDGQEESPETPEEESEAQAEGKKEKVENETIGSEDQTENADKDQGDAKEVEKEDEEDPSNLQLAWEMLELAKTILVKQAESITIVNAVDDKDAEVKEKTKLKEDVENRISDTYQTLGELSIENENYPQAIEDLETCLKRRQDMLPEDSRCIAETHYQIGVAQGFNLQFDEAVASLEGAIKCLQTRIDKLKTKTESIDPSKVRDAFYTRENEIKQIESLIPEIKEKIADTKDMKTETFKKLGDKRLMEEGIASAFGSAEAGSSNGEGTSKVASTISSTLIKKRPAATEDTTEPKKMHLDSSTTSSSENGHTKNGN